MKPKRTAQPTPVEMKTAEQHNAPLVGKIETTAPAESIWKPSPPNNLGCAGSLVRQAKDLLEDLREVRDLKLYVPSCHTFREWCMREFGERIGAWVDDNL